MHLFATDLVRMSTRTPRIPRFTQVLIIINVLFGEPMKTSVLIVISVIKHNVLPQAPPFLKFIYSNTIVQQHE